MPNDPHISLSRAEGETLACEQKPNFRPGKPYEVSGVIKIKEERLQNSLQER